MKWSIPKKLLLFDQYKIMEMKKIYLALLLTLTATALFSQNEELIPGALIGSCAEPDSNLITIYFDYNQNCPDADPGALLAGAEILGFHSGINNWANSVPFDSENAVPMIHLGNGIYFVKINTLEYYNVPLADIEEVNFVLRSAVVSDSWDNVCRDDVGGDDGFGNIISCNNFRLVIVNLPVCSEVEAETSASLLGPTTAANSCVDTTNNTVRIDFDLGLNCPESDPGNLLAGVTELGFHSGANDWSAVVDWDDASALRAANKGNDIFTVTVDPVAYYGVDLEDLENIVMVMNNGPANPTDPWANTGRDERDGGFGGTEPCSDLVLSIAETGICPLVIELNSSESVIEVFGEVATCVDPVRGRVRISFDLSKNCPEADSTNVLAGVNALGFHSGANNWTNTVAWDAENALQATNNGNNIFTVTIDVMEYYSIPFDSLRNIEFLFNNGIENPDDPWSATGKDPRDGDDGFGNIVECTNLLLDISEADECDLADVLTSVELTSGLAASCVDRANGLIRLEWDRNQNCPAVDSTDMLGDTIVLHSGVNTWANQVMWDNPNSMKPVNDGDGLYSMIIDVQDYYNISMDMVTEVNFLFNNGVARPDDPWAITGKANKEGGGFGGDDPCDNFLFVLSEAPACDLSEERSSPELFSGLAASCADTDNGKIRLDFDRNQNCPEADPGNLLGDTIALHSGINNWSSQVAWDAEGALRASNNGNGLYSLVIDIEDYYGVPMDSVSEVNFLYNNGIANPSAPWDNTGKSAEDGEGFGGIEPCSNFLFVLSEAPTCNLSDRQSSPALVTGPAASCVDTDLGKIRLDFDLSQNCSEADPGNLLPGAAQLGFHSGINGWATQVPFDADTATAAVNDGNDLFTLILDVESYYGVPLSAITEINFLYNNAFSDAADVWANTGKDETGSGGFGGDELCDNFLFLPATAATCDLSPSSTIDLTLENSIKVIPNPFRNEVLIRFDNDSHRQYELIVTDVSGKVVRRMTGLMGNQVRMEREDLSAGMYFARLRDQSGRFATTKIMVK